jgi:hypothetical protein
MSNQNLQLNNQGSNYIYRKTEKLVSAVYLLSSFISDKEPLKWQLRENGLKLLAQTISLTDRPIQGVSLITLIMSFLEAGYIGGIISEMNFNILKVEFGEVLGLMESEEKEKIKGAVFSDHFFKVSDIDNNLIDNSSKGQIAMSDRITRPIANLSVKNTESKQKDKSNRQEIIVGLLRKNKELSIKDFTSSIKDCSEKTIQRELVTLVSKGQIKKEGEKRWSRYSLK